MVRKQWQELRSGYESGRTSVAELSLSFGSTDESTGERGDERGDTLVQEELRMLHRWGAKTGNPSTDEKDDDKLELEEEHGVFDKTVSKAMAKQREDASAWTERVQQALDAFWLAQSLRAILPQLLRLRVTTAVLFDAASAVPLMAVEGAHASADKEQSGWHKQVQMLGQQKQDTLLSALCKVYEKLHAVYVPPKKRAAAAAEASASAAIAAASTNAASTADAKAREQKWRAMTLADVQGHVNNAKLRQLGGGGAVSALRDQTHAAFLGLLGAPNGIVSYLLLPDVADQVEFRRMLEVTKANVESPRLIASLAALVEVRMLLLGLLYGKGSAQDHDGDEVYDTASEHGKGPVYRGIGEFLEAYHRVPLTPTDVQRLQVLHTYTYTTHCTLHSYTMVAGAARFILRALLCSARECRGALRAGGHGSGAHLAGGHVPLPIISSARRGDSGGRQCG
jgi:hypothetical protein